jgi:peroxiredoxin
MGIIRGKVLLLFLSNIDCPGNQLSIPMLNSLSNKYKGRKFQIIGVFPENRSRLDRYVKSNDLEFPVLYGGMTIKNDYHSPGAPFFYIINQKNEIVKSRVGYSDDLQQMLTEVIDKVLL